MFHFFCIRSTWNFEIFSDFQKVESRKCRPIKKYATYEAKNFRKVVSKQKINLQKVSGVYVKRVKICGEKTVGGKKRPTPSISAKMIPWGWIFPKSCKNEIHPKKIDFFLCNVIMTSFCPKNRQNDVIWRQKSISVKILQMGWNFYTSSKIRQKTQKSA